MEVARGGRIVLISSGQPSLNPRLVKEADALEVAGYRVQVIYQYWNEWGTAMDAVLIPRKTWKAIRVGGGPADEPLVYMVSRIIHKFFRLLSGWYLTGSIGRLAIGRCGWLLSRKAVSFPADLYIAHNLAALPAAVRAARKNKAKCGFDAEDFHRNEVSDEINDADVRLKICIESTYLPQVDYLSTASPLISLAYQQLFPSLQPVTILNVFPRVELTDKVREGNLKLFWFSQTIGKDRGIEQIISAIRRIEHKSIELHLLGDHSVATVEYFSRVAMENLVDPAILNYYHPIHPDQLIEFASRFDVGMATETGVPYNREICLTNKIFTYMSAGLAIIASDTKAQAKLMAEHPDTGVVYHRADIDELGSLINRYMDDPVSLSTAQEAARLSSTTKLNWESEQLKLIKQVRLVLSA